MSALAAADHSRHGSWRGQSFGGTAIINATTVIWCHCHTCHYTHVTRASIPCHKSQQPWPCFMCTLPTLHASPCSPVASRCGRPRRPASGIRNFKGHCERPLWHENEAVAAIYSGYFRRQMTVVERIIAELHCLSNGGHLVDFSASYVRDGRGSLSETIMTVSPRTENT